MPGGFYREVERDWPYLYFSGWGVKFEASWSRADRGLAEEEGS